MDSSKSYEKWAEEFDLDDELIKKLHQEVIEAENDFKKISSKIKYGDPVTVDLIMALATLNESRLDFSTTAMLKQMERITAKILYQISKLQDGQDRIAEFLDKQLKHPSTG